MSAMRDPGDADEPWRVDERGFPADGATVEQARFLVRYAVLAPSSHNAQPWRFIVQDDRVDVLADTEGWLTIADADARELHVSLGCAIENLVTAARRFGFTPHVRYFPGQEHALAPVASVYLGEPALGAGSGATRDVVTRFRALTERRTIRHIASAALPAEVVGMLAGTRTEVGVTLHVQADANALRAFARLVADADDAVFARRDYRRELASFVGAGALGDNRLKAWIGEQLLAHVNVAQWEARTDRHRVERAPALGIVGTRDDAPVTRVRAGRVAERAWLTATALGLAVHPVSQPLQVPALRERLVDAYPDAGRPQFTFLVGYPARAPPPHTPRRSVRDVMDTRRRPVTPGTP